MAMERRTRAGDTPVRALVGDLISMIPPGADLIEVSRALASAGVGLLAVGEEGEVVGVVSERDVVRAVADGRDLATTRAIDVADTELVWVDAASSVADAAASMMEHYIRHLLVRDSDGRPGMVSARDLLGVYASSDIADTPDS